MHPCNLHDSILLPRLPYLARLIPQRLGRCPNVFAPARHSPQKTQEPGGDKCQEGVVGKKGKVRKGSLLLQDCYHSLLVLNAF